MASWGLNPTNFPDLYPAPGHSKAMSAATHVSRHMGSDLDASRRYFEDGDTPEGWPNHFVREFGLNRA